MSVSLGFSDKSLEETISQISEGSILRYYFGITEVPCRIQAPYRVDNKPSVGIYVGKNNRIQYIDFATRDSGSIIDLLSKMWRLDLRHTLDRIIKDSSKFTLSTDFKQNFVSNIPNHKISTSSIKIKTRNWKSYDLEYWESYGISLDWLKFGDVVPISHIFVTKDSQTFIFSADKYAYAYIEDKDNIITYKIYQPFNTERKWINTHNSSIWDLWTKLPETGEDLIITSSRKDALCIWENTGIPAVSLQGEGYIPKDSVVEELKKRFKNIFILYDNDFQADVNHGRKFGEDLAKKFNLTQLEIPDKYKSKDTSDLCKNYGRETVYRVINNLIYLNKNKVDPSDDLPF